MRNLAETEELDGFAVKLYFDECPENPRREWDHVGTMRCWHPRYDLGDKAKGQECPDNHRDFVAWADAAGAIYLPLYLYDHSGLTMSTGRFSCSWDSGQVGWIYVLPDKVKKEYQVTEITAAVRDTVVKCLTAEVKEYDQYLTGQVYWYSIEDAEGESVDSCSGLFGLEYARERAREAAKSCRAQADETAATTACAVAQAEQDAWAMFGDS